MAREFKFKDSDDFGFDSGLEIPEFNAPHDKESKDRHPVLRGVKDFGEGVVSGVWSAATSESYIKRVLKTALPTGYGVGIDTFDMAGQSLRKSYDSAAKEIKPLLNDMKRATNRILPMTEKVLPKGLQQSLKDFAASAESTTGFNPSQAREATLTATMGEVFKYQVETQAKERAEDQARSDVKEQIDAKRSEFQLGALNSIKMSLQRLVDYQDKITVNYQRRSLELQYRQYFVALDSFEHQRVTSAQNRQLLEGIQKNTGLPDIRKIQGVGDYTDLIKNKFFNNVGSMLFGERSYFMQSLVGNIQKAFMDNVKGFVSTMRMGLGAATDVSDMSGAMGDMGPSTANMAGDLTGDFVHSLVGDDLARALMKKIKGSKHYDKVDRFGKKLEYGLGNAPQHITEWAHSTKGDELPFGLGTVVQFLKHTVHQTNQTRTMMQQDTLRSLQEPAVFNGMARKSLTEIIPGYLARIYRELQIMRTGDVGTDMTIFDVSSNRFKAAKDAKAGIHAALFKKGDLELNRHSQKELADELERGTGEKMPAELRRDVMSHLMSLNFGNRMADPEHLTNPWSQLYVDNKGLANKGKTAAYFGKYFANNSGDDSKVKFQKLVNGLSYGMTDNRGLVQGLLNTGYGGMVDEMGLLNKFGNFNLETYKNRYLDGDEFSPTADVARGANAPWMQGANVNIHRTTHAGHAGHPLHAHQQQQQGGGSGIPPQFGQDGVPRVQRPSNFQKAEQARQERRNKDRINAYRKRRTVSPVKSLLPEPMHTGVHHEMHFASQDAIIHAIETHSARKPAEAMLDELKAIRQHLDEGLSMHHFHTRLGLKSIEDLYGKAADGLRDGVRGVKSWSQMTVKEASEKIGNMASGGAKWLAGRPGWLAGKAMQGWDATAGIRGKTMDKLRSGGEKALEFSNRFDDVYLPGVEEPVMLAWKMRMGYYINEKGNVIKTWKDIDGTIRDLSMNKQVVLTGDQMKYAYTSAKLGKKTLAALGAGAKWAWKKLGQARAGVFSLLPRALDLAKSVGTKAMNLLDQPQDVYVKDKSEPVLLARIMRAGHYRSANNLDHIIHRPGDIDGPVIDTSANPPFIALTREDLAGGIYDAFGKPIRTPMQKIMHAALTPLRWLKNTAKAGFDFTLMLIKKPIQAIGQFFTNWFGPDGIVFAGSKTIVERLTQIRDLLDQRIAKPRKIRKGSWEDLEAHKGIVGKVAGAARTVADKGFIGAGLGMAEGLGSKVLEKLGLKKDPTKPNNKTIWQKGFDWAKGKASDVATGYAMEKGTELAKKTGESIKDKIKDKIFTKHDPSQPRTKTSLKAGAKGLGRRVFGTVKDTIFGAAAPATPNVDPTIYEAVKQGVIDGMAAVHGGGSGIADTIKEKLKDKLEQKVKDKVKQTAKNQLGKFVLRRAAQTAATTGLEAAAGAAGGATAGAAGAAGAAAAGGAVAAEGGVATAAGLAAEMGLGGTAALGVGADLALGLGATLGTAALGVLFSPVVLGAAAVAVTGLGLRAAYRGVKHLITGAKMGPLTNVRLAQYGWAKGDDKDQIQAVLDFEQDVLQHVTYDSNGRAQLDHKKLKFEDALAPFGVEKTSKTDLRNWLVWFAQRFRPVLLTHLTALRGVNKKVKLTDVDTHSLKKVEKQKYLKAVEFPGGPYKIGENPFHRSSFLFMHFGKDRLTSGPKEVALAVAEAHKEVGTYDEKKAKEEEANRKKAATALFGAAAVGKLAGDQKNEHAGKPNDPNAKGKRSESTGFFSGLANASVLGMPVMGGLVAMAGSWIKNEWNKISSNQDLKGASFMTKLGVFLSPSLHSMITKSNLHPLEALRFKTYGLIDYDADKVSALRNLERHLGTRIKLSGQGEKAKAEFIGDPMDVLMHFGADFGASNVSEKKDSTAHDWLEWFMRRFLPTYLTYVGSYLKLGGDKSVGDFNPPDDIAATLAPLVAAAKGQDGRSVWSIKTSPWPRYPLETDADTVKSLIDFIKHKAKDAKKLKDGVPDNQKKDKKDGDAGKGWTDLLSGKNIKEKAGELMSWGKGVADKVGAWASKTWGEMKNGVVGQAIGSAWEGAKNSKVGKAITGVAGGVGDTMKGFGASLGKAYKAVTGDAKMVKDAALAALAKAGITNPTEMAMFMGQMDTESGGFKSLSENLNYSASTLMKLFGKKLSGGMQQAQQIASQGAQAVANFIYGNRMGNTAPDDGFKYRGRGIIQLTGKDNYEKYGKMLGLDLVNNPDLAADPKVAAQIAVAYWKTRVPAAAAQSGDVKTVTQAINGGQNGAASREQNFQKYLQQAKAGQLVPSGASPDDKKQQASAAQGMTGSGVASATPKQPVGNNNPTAGAIPTGGSNPAVAAATAPHTGGAPSSTPTVADTGKAQPGAAQVAQQNAIIAKATAPATPTQKTADATPSSGTPQNPFGFGLGSAKSVTPGTKNILAVQQAQHEERMGSMGGMNDSLGKSLEVQTDTRDTLKQILAAVQDMQKGKAEAGAPATQMAGGNANAGNGPKSALRGQQQPMPTPPVSMMNAV